MIDFKTLFEQLKSGIFNLAESTLKNYVNEAKTDGLEFLECTKEKLERWANLLKDQQLSIDEFEWLVFSQKELAIMNALKQAGLAQIRVDQFRASVLNLVTDTVLNFLKL